VEMGAGPEFGNFYYVNEIKWKIIGRGSGLRDKGNSQNGKAGFPCLHYMKSLEHVKIGMPGMNSLP